MPCLSAGGWPREEKDGVTGKKELTKAPGIRDVGRKDLSPLLLDQSQEPIGATEEGPLGGSGGQAHRASQGRVRGMRETFLGAAIQIPATERAIRTRMAWKAGP
jgi:hypothetical protein